jgi:cyclic pyranopterin phosphate synthase
VTERFNKLSGHSALIDNYNRRLNYLRISVTDKCNFRCSYCVSHTPSPKLKHSDILRYEEILRIVNIGVKQGINKIRITGGEPLVKKGIYDFLEKLSAVEGLNDMGAALMKQIESAANTGFQYY